MELTGNVVLAGDWHGNAPQAFNVIDYAVREGIKTIIQLGDFGIWEDDKKYLSKLESRLAEHDIVLYFIDGNHECVDAQTRAVTRRGLKNHWELLDSDEVLSVRDDGSSVWVPIDDIIVKSVAEPLVSVKSRGLDMLMTPGHRVVFRDRKGSFDEITADKLTTSQKWITVAGTNTALDDPSISDDQIRLYAWLLTDSHHRADGGWHLFQRESAAHRITDLLDRLGIKYSTSLRHRDITEICGKTLKSSEPEVTVRVGVNEGRKIMWETDCLDAMVWGWSERQVDLFIEEYIYCDGSTPTKGKNSAVLYSVDKNIIEDLRILITYNGYRSSEYLARANDHRLNICKKNQTMIHRGSKTSQPTQIVREDYSGEVWCVTVPTGRFFVERNGKIHLTGNCFPRLYAKKIGEDGTRKVRANIFHLPRGFRFMWEGYSVLALGGAASIDKPFRSEGRSWWPEELITEEDVQTAMQWGPVDILLAHDSPLTAPNSVCDDPYGQSEAARYFGGDMVYACNEHRRQLQRVTDVVTPRLVFHGHYHMAMFGTFRHQDEAKTPAHVYGLDQGTGRLVKHTVTLKTDWVAEALSNLDNTQ